jgi:cytochrome P450
VLYTCEVQDTSNELSLATMSSGLCPYKPNHDSIKQFDMLDPQARSNPHPYYAWLQDQPNQRVYQAPFEKSFFVVHRYDDVKYVLTSNKLFSSDILPTKQSPFLALMDGESHLRIRDVVNKIFLIDQAQFPKEVIKKFIQEATRDLIQKKHTNLLDGWATHIPLASLSFVFGLNAGAAQLQKLHNQAIVINRALFVLGGTGERRSADPTFPEKLSIAFSLFQNITKILKLRNAIDPKGLDELKRMFLPRKTRLENPRPNFSFMPQAISALLDLMNLFSQAIDDGSNNSHGVIILRKVIAERKITKTEAIMICTFVLFAGYETTGSLLSNCVAHLAKDYVLLNRLKNNPHLIESFMEESLRFYTPVGRFLRRANEDVTIGDQTIPKGSMVIAMLGAANTDPDRFDDAYSFIPDREKNNHISFGKGIHFCVGAPLARFQAMTALTELISHVNRLSLDTSKKLNMVTDRDNGILRYEELWVYIA